MVGQPYKDEKFLLLISDPTRPAMKLPALTAIFLLVFSGFSRGQDLLQIDSLVTALSAEKTDSAKCRLMMEIAELYLTYDTVIAKDFIVRSQVIGDRMEDKRFLGRSHELLGKMHTHFGHYAEAILDFDRAMAWFSEAEDNQGYYRVMKEKGNVHLFTSEYGQAMNFYETALDYYRRNGISDGAQKCLNNMGIIYKNRGQYLEALSVYEESLQLIDQENFPMEVARAYINLGNVFVYLGSYDRTLEYYQLALSIAEREGSMKEYALILLNTGVVQNKCLNYTDADDMYRQALGISRELGDPIMISNCLINIGTNYSELGRLEEGLEYVERGLAMKIELGDQRTISNCYIHMAEIYYKMGEPDRSSELFREAIPTKEELGDQEGLVRSYLGLAYIYFDQQDYARAEQNVDKALLTAQQINALEHVAAGYHIKQEIAANRNDYKSAFSYAREHSRISDSLLDKSTSNAVTEMEFRFRSKALQKENEDLRIRSALTAEVIQKRNAFLYAVAGIAILLAAGLVLGVHFFRRLRLTSLKLEEKNLVITRQNLKLDRLNRTKDRMMSIIAHDLRGTIGNQLTAIEVMNRVESGESRGIDQARLLANLKHSASYSLELLENLLHWSRLGENEAYFHPEEVKLDKIVKNCVSLFDETAKNKDIRVKLDVDEQLPLEADRIMLETIIRNLVSNAIKFSRPGGTINIEAIAQDGEVELKVSDEGVGMSGQEIRKVLNNGGFTKRGTSNEKGAGIGMTLVREFTSMHGGKLSIDSQEGEGTCISIALPVKAKEWIR